MEISIRRSYFMPKQKYSPEFKSKIILAILQGDKEFNVICSEHNLNPNMVHTWKREFLQNAPLAFSAHHERKEAKRKEDGLRKKNDQMLKTIGQLTLERDFLQDCFRQVGASIPTMPDYDLQKE